MRVIEARLALEHLETIERRASPTRNPGATTQVPMAKYGPDPKGDREQFTARLPKDHLAIYRAAAARRGMPLTDYLAVKLAEAHELPEPAYVAAQLERQRNRAEQTARRRGEETLPISA